MEHLVRRSVVETFRNASMRSMTRLPTNAPDTVLLRARPSQSPSSTSLPTRLARLISRRPYNISRTLRNETTPTAPSKAPTEKDSVYRARVARIVARLPKFTRKYTTTLLTAPASSIISFLILHEITAVVPLFTLAGYFHYTDTLPAAFAEGKVFNDAVRRFGRYARKKGWIAPLDEEVAEELATAGEEDKGAKRRAKLDKAYTISEKSTRLLVEFATAYAITKVLLPARVALSVWLSPAFARWVVLPVGRGVRGIFGRKA